MKEKPLPTRKLSGAFYVILLLLTAAIMAFLAVWAVTKNDLFLYLMLALFPLYLFHLIFHLVKTDKDYKKQEAEKSEFLTVAREEAARVVYITYLGDERHIRKPSRTKKDYLIEFYTKEVEIDLLKRHLWFDLGEREEERLIRCRIGSMEVPYSFLQELSGRTLLVQAQFFFAAEHSPLFAQLLSGNEIILYGE